MRPSCQYLWLGVAAVALGASTATACSAQPRADRLSSGAAAEVDSARVVDDLRFLSGPDLAGRATGTPGNEAARRYIQRELEVAGVRPFEEGWFQPFPSGGVNVVGFVPGSERPERFIVVTAHFDHLGTRNGQVYPGADDNASGTAGLIEIARQIAASPPRNSILFAALDAEEIGLRGARALVADPPVPLTAISLNVNLDMIGRSDVDELYAAGTHHYPSLTDLVERVAGRADIRLLRGHDRPDLGPRNDWTMLSDHAAFHEVGIPFIYFGVEDHDDYHSPTDTFENIQLGFFVQAVRTVLDFVREADAWLDEVDSVRAVDR
jgi:Zn-dependent M28 family amino/carboxypeptidase